MELEFKKDFDQAARRWDAFWRGQRQGRPLCYVVAPKDGARPVAAPKWITTVQGDIEPVIDQVLAWAGSHEFLGEAIPFYSVFFGPDHLAALLGADLKIHPDSPTTTWPQHFVDDWDDAEIAVQWDGHWWRRTVDCIRAFRRRCDGKLLLSIPTLQGGLDCLVALRGVEALFMDLMECPQKVQRALAAVNAAYDQVLAAMARELDVPRFGTVNRHGLYSRGPCNVPQCDVSCMLSPEMFQEFGLPAVAHEAATLDGADYHLDGPGAIKHLEAVCAVPGISAIQWQPGEGPGASQDWTGLYQRIDSLGQGHVLFKPDPDDILPLARRLESPRLFFQTQVRSRAQAETLLADLEKIRR